MSQIQTRGQYKASISHPVLLNELIFENIFSNLKLEHILPLRLVCRKWNTSIQKEISKDKKAIFSDKPNQRMVNNIPESVYYFKVLKLTKLDISPLAGPYMKTKLYDPIFIEALKECGSQVKKLKIGYDTPNKEGMERVKTVLSLTLNIETLGIPYFYLREDFCNVFKDFCNPKVRILTMKNLWLESGEGSAEDVVQTTVKCFPNLETNIGDDDLDVALLKMIIDRKVSIKLRRFSSVFTENILQSCNFLSQLSPRVHSLTRLNLSNDEELDQNKAKIIYKVLHNFASTLTNVKISWGNYNEDDIVISLPPLQQLRKLELVATNDKGDEVILTYDMGKRIGKDYPLLEYFTFNPVDSNYRHISGEKRSRLFWTSCKLLCPIVPVGNESFMADFDLEPLKSLKFVDMNIPLEWTKFEKNREWCTKFLDVYLKIYGNAGRKSIQHIVDWLM